MGSGTISTGVLTVWYPTKADKKIFAAKVALCAGFSDAQHDADGCARSSLASEKRQSTKSREVGRERLRQALWGFDRCDDGHCGRLRWPGRWCGRFGRPLRYDCSQVLALER